MSSHYYYRASDMAGAMPPKTRGEHRWIAITTFTLTKGNAAEAMGGGVAHLDRENMVDISVGCLDCEQAYNEADIICTAPAWTGLDRQEDP